MGKYFDKYDSPEELRKELATETAQNVQYVLAHQKEDEAYALRLIAKWNAEEESDESEDDSGTYSIIDNVSHSVPDMVY